jgi:hypothetical protein
LLHAALQDSSPVPVLVENISTIESALDTSRSEAFEARRHPSGVKA